MYHKTVVKYLRMYKESEAILNGVRLGRNLLVMSESVTDLLYWLHGHVMYFYVTLRLVH